MQAMSPAFSNGLLSSSPLFIRSPVLPGQIIPGPPVVVGQRKHPPGLPTQTWACATTQTRHPAAAAEAILGSWVGRIRGCALGLPCASGRGPGQGG
jgi:hypothetical protein